MERDKERGGGWESKKEHLAWENPETSSAKILDDIIAPDHGKCHNSFYVYGFCHSKRSPIRGPLHEFIHWGFSPGTGKHLGNF